MRSFEFPVRRIYSQTVDRCCYKCGLDRAIGESMERRCGVVDGCFWSYFQCYPACR